MSRLYRAGVIVLIVVLNAASAIAQNDNYTWKNLKIGGGGFVSGLVFSKTQQGLLYARTDVGGAYRWNAANSSWIPLLDWVSENETGLLGVESLATDPQQPANLYLLAGTSYFNGGRTAILKSADYGATFSIIDVTSQFKEDGNGMGRQTGEKLQVDPNLGSTLYCGSRANGLFKSTNSGSTWSRVATLPVTTTTNGNGISFVVLDPSSATVGNPTQTIIAGISQTGTNLYRSDNGGSSFAAITGGPITLMPHRAVLTSDNNLYVTYANAAGPWDITGAGQIWKYNLAGKSWTNVTPSGFGGAFGGISVDPNNPLRLVASSVNTYALQDGTAYGDRIFLSTNGGTSWTDIVSRGFKLDSNGIDWITGNAIHWAGCVEFDPFNSATAWIISGNGVWSTDNIDATQNVWKFNVLGLEETVPNDLVSSSNGPVMSAIGDYDGFRTTDVNAYSPINKPTMGSTTGIAVASIDARVMLRVGTKMYYSLDRAASWNECTLKSANGGVAVSADGKTFYHCPGASSRIYWSKDLGATWTAATGLSITDARPVADPLIKNRVYAYNPVSGSMMISDDSGVSFVAAGAVGTGGAKLFRATPDRTGDLWVALQTGGLYHSGNGGQTFTKIAGVTACSAVGLGKAPAGKDYPTVFIWGTVNAISGLWRSTDSGTTWKRVNDDQHEYGGLANGQFVDGDMNVFGRVYMSTAGRGIIYGESDQTCVPDLITPSVHLVTSDFSDMAMVHAQVNDDVVLHPEPATGGTWRWTGPNGFTATDREISLAAIQKDQAGIYTAWYTNASSCESGFQLFSVTVGIEAETIFVTGADDATTIDEPSGTLQLSAGFMPDNTSDRSVTWSIAEGAQLADISDSGLLTAHANGVVTVRATSVATPSVFGELDVTLTHQPPPLGIEDPFSAFTIYPNPTRGNFTVLSSSHAIMLELIDLRGRVILSRSFASEHAHIVEAILSPGVYVCKVRSAEGVVYRKLMVE